MRQLANTFSSRKQSGKIFLFVILITLIILLIAPFTTSEVFGESQIHIRYLDVDGKVLKEGDVSPGAILDPPENPYQEGMVFLGWDKYLGGHTTDTDINAVYELIMETTKEDKGKLAKPATAKPPKEVVVASSSEGAVTVDVSTDKTTEEGITSEEAVTTPDIIKTPPTPKDSGTEQSLSTSTVILLALASVVAVGLIGYIVFLIYKRKREQSN